jgi:four helix bundle protein
MASIRSHRDLEVWQDSMHLVELVYRLVDLLPGREQFGLSQQMRRAAVSIPANIAEGHCRHTRQAYLYHLRVALGSQAELETQLELAIRLGMVLKPAATECDRFITRVGKRLHALVDSLERRES